MAISSISQNIQSLKRNYWQKIDVEDEYLSTFRTTINLKLRLKNPDSKNKRDGILKDNALINQENLQNEIDRISKCKEEFLRDLQQKKKSDCDNWLQILIGISSYKPTNLYKKIIEIDKLEKLEKKYHISVSKEKCSDKDKDKENLISNYNSLLEEIDVQGKQSVKVQLEDIMKKNTKGISKFFSQLNNELYPKYREKRSKLFREKANLKNKLIESKELENWLPKAGLKASLKRDIISTFIQTELQMIANILAIEDKVRELTSIRRSNIMTIANYLMTEKSVQDLYQDLFPDSKVINEITKAYKQVKNYEISRIFTELVTKKSTELVTEKSPHGIYLSHIKAELNREIKDIEENLRQPFLQLRNWVSEEIKKIILIKQLGKILELDSKVKLCLSITNKQNRQKITHFAFPYEIYNFLAKAVKNHLEQYLSNKNYDNQVIKNIIKSYTSTYSYSLEEYKKESPSIYQLQDLVILYFSIFGNIIKIDSLDSNLKESFKQSFINLLQNSKSREFDDKVKSVLTEIIQKYTIISNKAGSINLQIPRGDQKNEMFGDKYPRLKGVARLNLNDALEKLINEDKVKLRKEDFRLKFHELLDGIDFEMQNKTFKLVGTQFRPLLNKIASDDQESIKFIEESFRGLVKKNGMIDYNDNSNKFEEIFIQKRKSLVDNVIEQINKPDKEKNLRSLFTLKSLFNFWITLKYNIRDKDRKSLEEKINELVSLSKYLSQSYTQNIYLADLLDVKENTRDQLEEKDGELWFSRYNNKDRVFLALRRSKDQFENFDEQDINDFIGLEFYKLCYTSDTLFTRSNLDSKFDQDDIYSQWQDFKYTTLKPINLQKELSNFTIFELQFGDNLARKFLFADSNNGKNPMCLFTDKKEYKDITKQPNSKVVITGLKITNPLDEQNHKNSKTYLRLTLLHLFTKNIEILEDSDNKITEGRDLGENILITASSFQKQGSNNSNQYKVAQVYNPFNHNAQFFDQYHKQIIQLVESKGYVPIAIRKNFRNKKKWLTENLINLQQKTIIENRNLDSLQKMIVYEDNLHGSNDKKSKTQDEKSAGLNEVNNILDNTRLFDINRIRKQFEQVISQLTFSNNTREKRFNYINNFEERDKTGIGITKTHLSSQMCINCGRKACTKKKKPEKKESENKNIWRVLADSKGSQDDFRTAKLHNNAEVAECDNCGFKTLCDYQAGLNLALFDIILTQYKERQKELSDDDLISQYTKLINYKEDLNLSSHKKVTYNQNLGIKNSIMEEISQQFIELQKDCSDKESYKNKLRNLGIWEDKKSKTLESIKGKQDLNKENTGEFSSAGFIRYLLLNKYTNIDREDYKNHLFNRINLKIEHIKNRKELVGNWQSKLEEIFKELDQKYERVKYKDINVHFGLRYNDIFKNIYNKGLREIDKVLSLENPNGEILTMNWLKSQIDAELQNQERRKLKAKNEKLNN
jgi:hypothetical protein